MSTMSVVAKPVPALAFASVMASSFHDACVCHGPREIAPAWLGAQLASLASTRELSDIAQRVRMGQLERGSSPGDAEAFESLSLGGDRR